MMALANASDPTRVSDHCSRLMARFGLTGNSIAMGRENNHISTIAGAASK
jgi:hypothetical protein